MHSMSAMKLKGILFCLPFACLAAFGVCFLLAASFYPGGHSYNPAFEGYSWVYNYYSDLFHTTAYNGEVNRGRPFALASLVLLELGFLSLWINLSNFWHMRKKMRIIANTIGLALVGSFSLLVHSHDTAVILTMLMGTAGFVCLVSVVLLHKEHASLLLTLIFFTAASTDFVLWVTRKLQKMQPLLQKFVLLMFAIWVVVLMMKVIAYNKRDTTP
jgi:hypothetical protein